MEFTRKRIRGRRQESYREWWDETESYRLTWRNEVAGIEVQAGFYAMVRVNLTGHEYIDFCGERRTFKTFKAAVNAAERHRKVWLKLLELAAGPRKGRSERIRNLDERARGGQGDEAYRILRVQPAWIDGQIEPHIMRLLFGPEAQEQNEDAPDDLSETSSTTVPSALPSPCETIDLEFDTPAESVGDSLTSSIVPMKTRKARSSRATAATELVEAPSPSVAKPTRKRSKSGATTAPLMTA